VRAIGAVLAATASERFVTEPVLSLMGRQEVDDLLRGHPDSSSLRVWLALSRRHLRYATTPWWLWRGEEVDRFGVDLAEIDRLVAAYAALNVGEARVDGDRIVFSYR
jgi:hypothetical protein